MSMDIRERLAGTVERRQFHAAIELREAGTGTRHLSGYASVFDRPYEVGPFTETILPGAFRRSLADPNLDVSLLVNHGVAGQLPLARTKSGTLALTEDVHGLKADADLAEDDPDVQALLPKLRRGDVSEMSISFRVSGGGQEWNDKRTDRKLSEILLHHGDVSIVTTGANPATRVSVRARDRGTPVIVQSGVELARARRARALAGTATARRAGGSVEAARAARARAMVGARISERRTSGWVCA